MEILAGFYQLYTNNQMTLIEGVDKNEFEEQGAGDQGMMFGYATNETENYMPLALELSNRILKELSCIRRENKEITYLRPDSKVK